MVLSCNDDVAGRADGLKAAAKEKPVENGLREKRGKRGEGGVGLAGNQC